MAQRTAVRRPNKSPGDAKPAVAAGAGERPRESLPRCCGCSAAHGNRFVQRVLRSAAAHDSARAAARSAGGSAPSRRSRLQRLAAQPPAAAAAPKRSMLIGPADDPFERERPRRGGGGRGRRRGPPESRHRTRWGPDHAALSAAPAASASTLPAAVDVPDAGGRRAARPTHPRVYGAAIRVRFRRRALHTGAAAGLGRRARRPRLHRRQRRRVRAAGEYRPGTREGTAFSAHELTHVVQQSGGAPPGAHAVQREAKPGKPVDASPPPVELVVICVPTTRSFSGRRATTTPTRSPSATSAKGSTTSPYRSGRTSRRT